MHADDSTDATPAAPDPRARPRAVRELAGMFDDVSGRYDFLNRVMSLGRDDAWRRAMWDEVPEDAHAVMDLCCGSGTSLSGLRRPGRLVMGADISLRMLELAARSQDRVGWAPRLVGADAFRIPVRDASLDCVTIAFGMRNLRPRTAALGEIARALRPGGELIVLEATAPRRGPVAPFHRFYVLRMIPLAGRLSSDPTAYRYLSRSIIEFGSGSEFEADLDGAGFEIAGRRSFMLGAIMLWTARRRELSGVESSTVAPLHAARVGKLARGEMPNAHREAAAQWRWWTGAKLLLSAAVLASLLYALRLFAKFGNDLRLESWQVASMRVLLIAATLGFAVRTALLGLRFLGPPPRN